MVVMNSWKNIINTQTIHLNVRSDFYHLYSKTLHDKIQIELSKNIGKAIKLHIIKNDDYLKKTPIEYIYLIYQKQISKLVQNLLDDPKIIMIKSFFNIEFDKSDIEII